MRLDKYTKEAIARAIMQDVPKPPHNVLKEEIQAALVKSMSPDVRKIYKTKPKALATARLASYECLLDFGVDFVVGDADYVTVFEPYKAALKAHSTVRDKVTYAINSCTSLKQLKDRLPEFEKYFPKEDAASKNLPAVANMVADLTKLGWPKTSTKGESK